MQKKWFDIKEPLTGRLEKPREKGLTMVLDKGLGLNAWQDLLNTSHQHIDFLKFSFGTSAIFSEDILKKKIRLAKLKDIDIYPGGTLFEIAVIQNKMNEFFTQARKTGFTTVEISNGTINMDLAFRKNAIKKAADYGFKVLTEVGKKDSRYSLNSTEIIAQITEDLSNGAHRVIIEGRESGKGVSIYKDDGSVDMKMFEHIVETMDDNQDLLIWEAPLKNQQVKIIKELGPNVNIGNINFQDIIAVESLRRGLRGDTFSLSL